MNKLKNDYRYTIVDKIFNDKCIKHLLTEDFINDIFDECVRRSDDSPEQMAIFMKETIDQYLKSNEFRSSLVNEVMEEAITFLSISEGLPFSISMRVDEYPFMEYFFKYVLEIKRDFDTYENVRKCEVFIEAYKTLEDIKDDFSMDEYFSALKSEFVGIY